MRPYIQVLQVYSKPVAVDTCSVSCQGHTLAITQLLSLESIAELSEVCAVGPVLFEKC